MGSDYERKFQAYQNPGVDEAIFYHPKKEEKPLGLWERITKRWRTRKTKGF